MFPQRLTQAIAVHSLEKKIQCIPINLGLQLGEFCNSDLLHPIRANRLLPTTFKASFSSPFLQETISDTL